MFTDIIAENFHMQVQHAGEVSKNQMTMTGKRSSPKHILFKLLDIQQKATILSTHTKKITYKIKPIKITADFSAQTLHARGD